MLLTMAVELDPRMVGDDRDAVVGGGLERRGGEAERGQLGHVRVVVGDLGPGRRPGVPG